MSAQLDHVDVAEPNPAATSPVDHLDQELYWLAQYEWLVAAGYRLRSRYSPDWTPSWYNTNVDPRMFEDAQKNWVANINYAVDLKKRRWVTIKKVDSSPPRQELEVTKALSTEPLKSNPANHAIQPIDILPHPTEENTHFLVLPTLRSYDDPPFETVGEIISFVRQLLEGVNFLHENSIVHGDVSVNNVMMDATELYPEGFHPLNTHMSANWRTPVVAKHTRTETAPKYFLIDFGCSRIFRDGETLVTNSGTDRTVPEYKDMDTQPLNGYHIDVYCVGNLLKHELLDGDPDLTASHPGYENLEFLRPLVEDMTQKDPSARPTMAEALKRLDAIIKKLSFLTLRAPCVKKPGLERDEDEPRAAIVIIAMHHWYKAFKYAARRLPSIPQPRAQKSKTPKKGRKKPDEESDDEDPAVDDETTPTDDALLQETTDPIPDCPPSGASLEVTPTVVPIPESKNA